MIPLRVIMDADAAWPDLADKPVIHLDETALLQVGVLSGGMVSGRPSIAIRFDLPDGRVVIAETSARLFVSAAKLISGKFPDLFDDLKGGSAT